MRVRRAGVVLLGSALAGTSALGAQLETERYVIEVQSMCPEGDVACDRIVATATDRSSGRRSALQGETWHLPCADGITPCRFLGYRFTDGDSVWLLHDDGRLEIHTAGSDCVLRQPGQWQPRSPAPTAP